MLRSEGKLRSHDWEEAWAQLKKQIIALWSFLQRHHVQRQKKGCWMNKPEQRKVHWRTASTNQRTGDKVQPPIRARAANSNLENHPRAAKRDIIHNRKSHNLKEYGFAFLYPLDKIQFITFSLHRRLIVAICLEIFFLIFLALRNLPLAWSINTFYMEAPQAKKKRQRSNGDSSQEPHQPKTEKNIRKDVQAIGGI